MRVFVLGKPREVTHWTEDCLAGFQAAGHDVLLGVTRDARLHPGLERVLMARWTGGFPVHRLLRALRSFRPDLILAIRAFATPVPILERVAAIADRPPLIGWVGDAFTEADRPIADHFDAIGYTDTALLSRHKALGFRAAAGYVPHAANPLFVGDAAGSRRPRIAFVANPTPRRRSIVGGMARPIALFGPGWTTMPAVEHLIEPRRIGTAELGAIYRSHLGVLNVHHEENVVAGLNQRHFDPGLSGTPVLSDAQPDLPHCFVPGREVLVWHDVQALDEVHERVLREPDWALSIGEAARRRTLSEHLYEHRLEALRRLV